MAGTDTAPFHVRSVVVTGSEFTKQSLFSACLEPVYRARTLGEVLGETQRLVNRLKRLGIFEDVDILLDKSRLPMIPPEQQDSSIDLVLIVKERKRLSAKTGTEMGSSGGNVNTSISFRNAFGNAETIEATAAYGVEAQDVLDRNVETPLGSTASSSFSVGSTPYRTRPNVTHSPVLSSYLENQ